MLKNSARMFRLALSRRRMVRKTETDVLAAPGPLSMCWPLLPRVPCRGCTNAAVLNHCVRLCVKPLRGSPTCCARSSPESEQLHTSPDAWTENGNPPCSDTLELAV